MDAGSDSSKAAPMVFDVPLKTSVATGASGSWIFAYSSSASSTSRASSSRLLPKAWLTPHSLRKSAIPACSSGLWFSSSRATSASTYLDLGLPVKWRCVNLCNIFFQSRLASCFTTALISLMRSSTTCNGCEV